MTGTFNLSEAIGRDKAHLFPCKQERQATSISRGHLGPDAQSNHGAAHEENDWKISSNASEPNIFKGIISPTVIGLVTKLA
jgi:hypothetical protein